MGLGSPMFSAIKRDPELSKRASGIVSGAIERARSAVALLSPSARVRALRAAAEMEEAADHEVMRL